MSESAAAASAAPAVGAAAAAAAAPSLDPEAAALLEQLQLSPHPEGGFYRETFRDEGAGPGQRALSTAIYYLLPAGTKSKLHRLDASEVWHFYRGGPITIVELSELLPGGGLRTTTLGPDPAAGHALQHVVPPGVWFGAFPQEGTRYALVGCTVAPGFQFESLEFGSREGLLRQFPGARQHVDRLLPAEEE